MKEKPPPSRCLAVLGTGSDVGKSIVVTALCRIFNDRGVKVAPFKAQNMSNNSFVTLDGKEMGRAQVVQAEAARTPIHVDMNPVLLKPSSNTGAQVVVHGLPMGNRQAADYFRDTQYLYERACDSLHRLRSGYELVIMEGAGSCAEVNLRERDFTNFRMAKTAGAPVILVADIDRGGVFAQIVGTLEVIPAEYRDCVRGLIVNKFRGDASLFKDGIDYIENRTGLPVLGLVPYFRHVEIDSEDGLSLALRPAPHGAPDADAVCIAVLHLPHISNFTDFAPLQREPSVDLRYLERPQTLNGYDLLILPGSKNVRADVQWLRSSRWDERIMQFAANGGRVAGVCGGYQMLGRTIYDPCGVEGAPGQTEGLGLLDVETTLLDKKTLCRSEGFWTATDERVEGYEIHMGATRRLKELGGAVRVTCRDGCDVEDLDGARNRDGKVWGTYFHGLFDLAALRRSLLMSICPKSKDRSARFSNVDESDFKETQYNLLADHFREYVNMHKLLEIIRPTDC